MKKYRLSGISLGVILGVIFGIILVFSKNSETTLEADYPSYESQTALEDTADVVIEGRVIGKEQRKINIAQGNDSSDPKINPTLNGNKTKETLEIEYTVSKVKVSEVYKGEGVQEGDVIEVKEVANSESENSNIKKEGSYLLFLARFPNGIPYSLLNPIQSSYLKDNDHYMGNNKNKIKIDISKLKNRKTTSAPSEIVIRVNNV